MFIFLTIIILIAAVLLVAIVVIQNSKGGGLASGFATGNSMMGVRKTTDFLEKTTWWLTGIIVVLSIASAAFIPSPKGEKANLFEQSVKDNIKLEEKALPNLGGDDKATPMPQEGNTTSSGEEKPAEEPVTE